MVSMPAGDYRWSDRDVVRDRRLKGDGRGDIWEKRIPEIGEECKCSVALGNAAQRRGK
jgi:hypothetical protein